MSIVVRMGLVTHAQNYGTGWLGQPNPYLKSNAPWIPHKPGDAKGAFLNGDGCLAAVQASIPAGFSSPSCAIGVGVLQRPVYQAGS